jgi:polyferredoxin
MSDAVQTLARSPQTDRRTWTRPAVQFGFVIFSILLCIEFRGFVLSLEDPHGPIRPRPAAVDAWLPISSLLSLTYYIRTGIAADVHPAGLVIFSLTILLALAIRRGFCSWVCPIGTGAEYAHKTGKILFGANLRIPKWIDLPLRAIKYLLLGFFLYSILRMPVEGLHAFIHGPYNRIADVKMYLFFADITPTALAVIAVLAALSILIKNFWCRYLCPYGALLGIFSYLSPTAVRRNTNACTGCGACTRACPNRIAVHRKTTVRSPLCTACLTCVNACKVPAALEFAASFEFGAAKRKWRLSPAAYALITVIAFLAAAQLAQTLGYWHSSTPDHLYKMLYASIHQINHP